MNQGRSSIRLITATVLAFLISTSCAVILSADEKIYTSTSGDEVEVLLLVLRSEVAANKWTKKDLICFSVEEMVPSPDVVKALRHQHLNVCSSADWPKKFICGFEVRMRFVDFDALQSGRIRAEVVDNRDINAGQGDLTVLVRTGEYAVRKIDGKWRITDYASSK